MTIEELKKLPVNKISDDNCILFMWVTFPMIEEALRLVKAWGFTFKTIAFTWIKKNPNGSNFMGMGNWTRSNAEIVFLSTKGKPKRIDAGIKQIIESTRQKFSKKPNMARQKIIELCGDLPRIELFARTKIHGWDTWGNDPKLEQQPLESFN